MTTALKKAFAKASGLPKTVQDQLAEQLLEEIAGELLWEQTLGESQDLLETMAAKARKLQRQGKTTKKGFDQL